MLEKNDSNTLAGNARKLCSGDSKLKAIAEINQILKTEKKRKKNLHLSYSLLSLRELTGKLNDAGISISHVSLWALLKARSFFIYGQSESFKSHSLAIEKYMKHIELNISSFHKSCNPVVFVDIKKVMGKKSHDIIKDSTCLKDILIEWWNGSGSKKYLGCSRLLIFAKDVPLKANKQIFQKFANETGLGITFYHIPIRIIKWFNIEPENFCKTICIKLNGKKNYYNASIHLIIQPEENPRHDFKTIHSAMVDKSGYTKIDYFSPPEWYYTLKPMSKGNKP